MSQAPKLMLPRPADVMAQTAGSSAEEGPGLGRLIWIAAFIIVLGFGGFVTWAVTAQLTSAAVAPGVVAVESRRKPVQHFEGGIVSAVLVEEGDLVEEGTVLFRIDDTQSQSRRRQLTVRLVSLEMEKQRLQAELSGAPVFTPDVALAASLDPLQFAEMISTQNRLFSERQEELRRNLAVAVSSQRQVEQSLVGLGEQILAREFQLELVSNRLSGLEQIGERGFASQVQIDQVRGEASSLNAQVAQLQAEESATQERLAQLREEQQQLEAAFRTATADRLQRVDREVAEVQESLIAAEDVVNRTEVTAPSTGTVVGLAVNAPGAVISAGDTLLELVPQNDDLVIDTFIRPADIDVVRVGLPVKVRLTAYNVREVQPLEGQLSRVSADRVVDARTGTASFSGQVVVDAASLAAAEDVALYPGMPAEVLIILGERTFMDYLLDPLVRVVDQSFLEQ